MRRLNKVNGLKENIEFTQNDLKETIDNGEKSIEKLESDSQEIYQK